MNLLIYTILNLFQCVATVWNCGVEMFGFMMQTCFLQRYLHTHCCVKCYIFCGKRNYYLCDVVFRCRKYDVLVPQISPGVETCARCDFNCGCGTFSNQYV